LTDRGGLRAKPSWFGDLITTYEGLPEGPTRALENAITGIDGIHT
jgi:hypothetical protein